MHLLDEFVVGKRVQIKIAVGHALPPFKIRSIKPLYRIRTLPSRFLSDLGRRMPHFRQPDWSS